MKISTRGRYALRLMLDLSINYTGEYIPIKTIAARQGISEKYLEQIITQLSRAGYVKSIRGAQGGYMLSKDPSQYTVGMILRLLEGSLSPVACLDSEETPCERINSCVTVDIWRRVKEAIEGVVDNITLADLVEDYKEKNSLDFCI